MELFSFVKLLREECVQMLRREQARKREGLRLRLLIESSRRGKRKLMN
ncbi:MAG: hypothetical protein ACK4SM_02705 [Aquificaceae bacterium]